MREHDVDPMPEAVRFLSLTAPGLLEASAGSGKTFAIEHLVVRLLKEKPDLNLSGILLVTYTEKAAGELKEKIRRRLLKESQRSGLDIPTQLRLKEAHLHFDQASVYTIHGFCLQVLKRYAFENRGLFEFEVVEDGQILREALLGLRRRYAAGESPEALKEGLLATRDEKQEQKLLALAKAYRPERGDSLAPTPDLEKAATVTHELRQVQQKIRELVVEKPDLPLVDQPWFLDFAASHGTKTKIKKFLSPLESLFQLCADTGSESNAPWQKKLNGGQSLLKKNPAEIFASPEGGFLPKAQAIARAMPTLLRQASSLLLAVAEAEQALALAPMWHLLQALSLQSIHLKSEQGGVSYDDMIAHLWRALSENDELVDLVRRQYRYGIVDEFQDTDPVQWAIFKKVFLESEGQNPLYLVGDPKQAIYGFRGGDLHTYLTARATLEALSLKGKAYGTRLDQNFRSRADLISALNTTFAQPEWFAAGEEPAPHSTWKLSPASEAISFLPSQFGNAPRQRYADHTPHAEPVLLCTIPGDKADERLWATAKFAAETLATLLAFPQSLLIPDGENKFRAITAGDICVLVQNHKEKIPFERAFRMAGIPYSVYKQGGLFQSDEAGHLLALLQAWQDPSNAATQLGAALSRFGLEETRTLLLQRTKNEAVALSAGSMAALDNLRTLALEGKWPRVFHGLFHTYGLFGRDCIFADGAERIARWRQLAQLITREARLHGLDLEEVIQRVQAWRRLENPVEDEMDLQREGQSTPKVLLLTMHASKGLEFPIVFLGCSSKKMEASNPRRERDPQSLGWCIHLGEVSEEKETALQQEAIEEYKRLYYVALTRAQFKLFIPLPSPSKSRDELLPLTGFVGAALRAAAQSSPLLFGKLTRPWTVSDFQDAQNSPSIAMPSARLRSAALSDSGAIDPFASSPKPPYVAKRRRRLTSYSSLAARRQELIITPEGKRLTPDEFKPKEELVPLDSEGLPLQEFAMAENKSMAAQVLDQPHPRETPALPRGAATGNLLHGLLEKVDFSLALQAENKVDFAQGPAGLLIAAEAAHYGLNETFHPSIATILWHTLRTPLTDAAGGASFRLAEVGQRFAELEFLMPISSDKHNPLPAEMRQAGGYLWGYIDLVFKWRDKVYFIDWKSNTLEDYHQASLSESIQAEAYDLQYRLYAVAVHRWLKNRWPTYSPEKNFGGFYYLYLRGLGADAHSGIFHLRPSPADLEQTYPAYIAEVLGVKSLEFEPTYSRGVQA